ncbi:MAG TPA: hypothetical protein VJI67_00940, partial [archaeon]|nr:hypothetical protein [archaeon]
NAPEFKSLADAPDAKEVISALIAAQEVVEGDFKAWASADTARVIEGLESLKEADDEETKKDFLYRITQFLGMKSQEERKTAETIKEGTEKLGEAVESIEELSNQVSDVSVKAELSEKARELREKKEKLDSVADEKARGAAGVFSLIGAR